MPYRAVLEELRRLRVVRQIGNRLELNARRQMQDIRVTTSLAALIPVLIDGIRLAVKAASAGSDPVIHRLTLTARDQVELARLQDRAVVGIAALLNGLKGSLQRGKAAHDRSKYALTLTAFVTEQSTTKPTKISSA